MKKSLRRAGHRRNRCALHQSVATTFEPLDPRVLMSGSAAVTVRNDLNHNGTFEAGEGLAGWTVFVDSNPENGVQDATDPKGITDSSGKVTINGIAAGTWDIYEVVPSGFAPAPGFKSFDRTSIRDNKTDDVLFMNVPV